MCCCDGCKFIENFFGCVSKSMRVSMCGKANASQIDWMCEPSSWSDGPNIAWTPDSICWHTVANELEMRKKTKMQTEKVKNIFKIVQRRFMCAPLLWAADAIGINWKCSRLHCGIDWTTCSNRFRNIDESWLFRCEILRSQIVTATTFYVHPSHC